MGLSVARLADLEAKLGRRWLTDPRTPALFLQASMCLLPGWRFVGILSPTDQGGLMRHPGKSLRLPIRERGREWYDAELCRFEALRQSP